MRETGQRTRHREGDSICTATGQGLRDCGLMIKDTGSEWSHGLMGPGMREIIAVGARMGSGAFFGQIIASIMESSLIIILKGRGLIFGWMEESLWGESGGIDSEKVQLAREKLRKETSSYSGGVEK